MNIFPLPLQNTRLGIHYFPDTLHYRESDLDTWLPELKALKISWLTLEAPLERLVPEAFLGRLIQNGIEPLLRLNIPLGQIPDPADYTLLFESYSRWGVHYICLFDCPNSRDSWPPASWAQQDLVERFLDRFIPIANSALEAGLTPIFPPLEPGGDYWDTSFLRSSLESLLRRKQTNLIDHLVLSAYTEIGTRDLNWGAGGPERWSAAKPYYTPDEEQDQRGFHISDWYIAISDLVLKQKLPVMVFEKAAEAADTDQTLNSARAQQMLTIYQLLTRDDSAKSAETDQAAASIAEEVLTTSFWLLAADAEDSALSQVWFGLHSDPQPFVKVIKEYLANQKKSFHATGKGGEPIVHPIEHYLLLPLYEWGVSDWHLDTIKPFVKKYRPTVGFSLSEAAYSRRVTVIGGIQSFSEDDLNTLRTAGCEVERIAGDGTSIATQLAER
jgi:hypothetical protein